MSDSKPVSAGEKRPVLVNEWADDWYELHGWIDKAQHGDRMEDIVKKGIKVIGPNTSSGEINVWHFDDEENANTFAKGLCQSVRQTVLVTQLLGAWKPARLPVEHIEAEHAK